MDFTREADELINLVFDAPMNSETRTRRVADWLREFLAAASYGCTGLTSDPEGPELKSFRSRPGETSVEPPEDEAREADRKLDEAERFGWPAFPSMDEPRAT